MEIVATTEETLTVRALHMRRRNRPLSTKEAIALSSHETASRGREIPGYPILTGMTGGLRGLWIVGGMPKVGKSSVALNIVARVTSVEFPCFYLDLENDTGPLTREIDDRIASAYGTDAEVRDSFYSYRRREDLEADLRRFAPAPTPALIVLDHLQVAATGDDSSQKRASLDQVVRWCQERVLEGYTVIALSQIGRGAYGQCPTLASYKESSAIEAAATAALFVWTKGQENSPRVRVAAIRNAPRPDHEVVFRRETWLLTEARRVALAGARVDAAVNVEGPKLSPVQKAFLGRETAALTTDEVLRSLGRARRGRSTGERWIAQALKARQIEQIAKGTYRIPHSIPHVRDE